MTFNQKRRIILMHTEAERTVSTTQNFIVWVDECMK